MRSALYYPFTTIQSDDLIRTSLLMWDKVHIMVPWHGFGANFPDRDRARALELISVQHVPTHEEKKEAHDIVEDFATRPLLPDAFSYTSGVHNDDWPVYRDKLLPETWRVLEMAGLAGNRALGSGVPVSKPTGLSLLSILADCCAGKTLARITDIDAAYGVVAGLLATTEHEENPQRITESLAAVTLKIIDTREIPLSKLISFREREEKSALGHELRALRHGYLDRLSKQVVALVGLKKAADRAELLRQFDEEMSDDLRGLRTELKLSAKETLLSKEVLIAALAGATALASPFFHFLLPELVTFSGGIVSIGGLLATNTKFVKSRREVLRKHPMAYLYELKGGHCV